MELQWDAIGAVGEILGAVAVIATLIYLARELAHTQNSAQLTASERLIRAFDDVNRLVLTDASVREMLILRDEPTDTQREQLYVFAVLKCNMWMSAQDAQDRNQISAELYAGAAKDVHMVLLQWPILIDSFRLWLERYPEVSDGGIFEPLREAVRNLERAP